MSVGCLEGVWEASGGCLNDSEIQSLNTVWGYVVQAFDKQPITFEFISCFILSQNGNVSYKFRISVGCLGGVWKVSVACLDNPDTVWGL